MPTTTTKKSARVPASKPARVAAPRPSEAPLEALQHTLEDLESLSDRAGSDIRSQFDVTTERIRSFATELRERTEKDLAEWQKALDHASADVLRELGVRAVRVQRSPAALTAMSAEIRARRAELRAANGSARKPAA